MYFLWLRDRESGPHSLEEVQGKWAERAVHSETLYWQEGLPDWTPLHAIRHVIEGAPARMVLAGVWRRSTAFVVDTLVLGGVGYASGLLLFDFYLGFGSSGILLGFAISSAYFGLLDSSLADGQTLGKRACGIRLVDASGSPFPPGRCLIRFLILSLPFWLYKVVASGILTSHFRLQILLWVVAAGGLAALAYPYLFNRRSRQSLHDLAVGSYVIRKSSPPSALAPMPWRGHLPLAFVLGAMVMGGCAALAIASHRSSLRPMFALGNALIATKDVKSVIVTEGTGPVVPNSQTRAICDADVVLQKQPRSMETATNEIAHLILKTDPAVSRDESLHVSVTYGYDIGIAWSSVSESDTRTPEAWKQQFEPPQD